MNEEIKKYKITDKPGADLFLNAIHPAENKSAPKIDETGEELKKLKSNTFKLFSIIAVITVVLAIAGYFGVKKYRYESILIRDISLTVSEFEEMTPTGQDINDEYAAEMKKADSLLILLDNEIKANPKKDTLKTMWTSVLLHKYEKYLHFSLKNSLYDDLKKIDTLQIIKAQKYNSDYTNLVPIMYYLPDFYRFWEINNAPPRLSFTAPKQFEIEELIDKAKEVQYIAEKNAVILEVHFPILSSWLTYFSNTVIPQIYEWDAFWRKYKEAIGNTNDKLNYDKIMRELTFEYPNLQILKDNGYGQNISGFRLGMVDGSLTPVGSNIQSEMNPFLDYLKKSFNQDMNLVLFNDYFELFQALKNGKVDFAVMNFAASATCYFSGVGLPIAQRSWNRTRYMKYSIYGVGQDIKNDSYLSSAKIGSLLNDDYLFYKYFESGNFNINKMLDNQETAPKLDVLLNMINSGKCGAVLVSDEEYFYLKSSNKLSVNLYKYRDVGVMPLDVIWARDSIAPSRVKTLQNIIIPVMPSDIYKTGANPAMEHPNGDWDAYENAVIMSYYNDSRKLLVKLNEAGNRIHLFPIISESDSVSNRLKKELTEYLEETGFKVTHYNNNVPTSKNPNDNYVTVKASKDNTGKYKYYFEVHQFDKTGKKLVYREQFQPGQGKMMPDLHQKLFDLASHLNIFGKVSKIEGREVIISTNVDLPSAKGKTLYLFKRNQTISDLNNYYAKLIVKEYKKGKIIADIGDTPLKYIKTGDIGVIINVKK